MEKARPPGREATRPRGRQAARPGESQHVCTEGVAFPTCISVNEIVGHFSPLRVQAPASRRCRWGQAAWAPVGRGKSIRHSPQLNTRQREEPLASAMTCVT